MVKKLKKKARMEKRLKRWTKKLCRKTAKSDLAKEV
jgi:hypothetical protein